MDMLLLKPTVNQKTGLMEWCPPAEEHAREQEAQATQLARSYIHDVLVIAHENQPVAALGCSSGKQTCLVKQPWKVRAVAERRSNTPSDRTAREHTPCVPHYPSSL